LSSIALAINSDVSPAVRFVFLGLGDCDLLFFDFLVSVLARIAIGFEDY
jgi:hypothetical protein